MVPRLKLSRPRLVTALGVLSPEFAALVSEILGEEPKRADRPPAPEIIVPGNGLPMNHEAA